MMVQQARLALQMTCMLITACCAACSELWGDLSLCMGSCRNAQLFNFNNKSAIQSSKLLTYLADLVSPLLLLKGRCIPYAEHDWHKDPYRWKPSGALSGSTPAQSWTPCCSRRPCAWLT